MDEEDDYIPFEGSGPPKPPRKVSPEEIARLKALIESMKKNRTKTE
jgi:hypothetical protein